LPTIQKAVAGLYTVLTGEQLSVCPLVMHLAFHHLMVSRDHVTAQQVNGVMAALVERNQLLMAIALTDLWMHQTVFKGLVIIESTITVDQIQVRRIAHQDTADPSELGKQTPIQVQDTGGGREIIHQSHPDTGDIMLHVKGGTDVEDPLAAGPQGIQGDEQLDTARRTIVGHLQGEREAIIGIDGILPIAVVEAADLLG
jgi:hypothetical protein